MSTHLVKLCVNWALAYYLMWTFCPPFFGDAYGYTQQFQLPFVESANVDPKEYEAQWLIRAKYHGPYWMWAGLFVLSGTVGKEWLKTKFLWLARLGFVGSTALSLSLVLLFLLVSDLSAEVGFWPAPRWILDFDLVGQGPSSAGILLPLSLFGEVWDWAVRELMNRLGTSGRGRAW